eukprot:TRINITY_DN66549_c0_g1_i1.p3 TRINITY_DN66549_c0_g1~~TRINITY_DN66549_c0_g1_i1.p3  ORF type:complete len:183 (+),score=36.71 TRINITY_DN66549_c0_g1_i1:79-627(+)
MLSRALRRAAAAAPSAGRSAGWLAAGAAAGALASALRQASAEGPAVVEPVAPALALPARRLPGGAVGPGLWRAALFADVTCDVLSMEVSSEQGGTGGGGASVSVRFRAAGGGASAEMAKASQLFVDGEVVRTVPAVTVEQESPGSVQGVATFTVPTGASNSGTLIAFAFRGDYPPVAARVAA